MTGNGVGAVDGHKKLTSNKTGSSDLRAENVVEDDAFPEYDWEDHRAHQLQALLIKNYLHGMFQTAVEKVESCGYNQLVIGSMSHGGGDVVLNSVDGLRNLEKYFLLETTNMVLKVRSGLTTAKAMQCMLMSDIYDLWRAQFCP